MNKQEFLAAFQRAMDALGVSDHAAHYAFFEELFDDMAEEGISEAEITARLGNPWELAASLLREELGTGERETPEHGTIPPDSRHQPVSAEETMQVTQETNQTETDRFPRGDEGKGTSRPSWRDKLNRLLNTAGIRLEINGEIFVSTDTYETVHPAAGIDELEIHWMAGELEVSAGDREDILLSEDRSENVSPMRVEVRGSTLCVFFAQDGSFHGSKDLTVTLPSGLAGSLRRCTVQTLSADTTLEELAVQELSVKSASGNQDIRLKADRASLTSASGDMDLELTVRELAASTASGDMNLSAESTEIAKLSTASGDICCRGSIERLSMNSASGDMEFSGDAEQIQVKTASGDCSLELDQAPEALSVTSVSGDVEVALPHGTACQLKLNSRTGNVEFSGIRTDVQDAPVYRIQTVSGDINIYG